jgi:hypothetical protein
VYDLTASRSLGKPCWHTWTCFDGNGGFTPHNSIGLVYVNNSILTGDEHGNLLEMSFDYTTDFVDGVTQPIIWERTTPHVSNEMKRMRHISITLDFATGVAVDPNLDPQVMMQFSDDGGATWSDERWVTCGKIGQYGLRVKYFQLGSALSRVYRFSGSDDIAWSLSGAYLEVEAGRF